MTDFKIAPSILSADFARLGEEVEAVLEAGADFVHFDVMDNHYVPNLTIGPLVCEALRKHGIEAPIDVHLMVRPVDRIVGDFAAAGAELDSLRATAVTVLADWQMEDLEAELRRLERRLALAQLGFLGPWEIVF